jgi:hypothetical protein
MHALSQMKSFVKKVNEEHYWYEQDTDESEMYRIFDNPLDPVTKEAAEVGIKEMYVWNCPLPGPLTPLESDIIKAKKKLMKEDGEFTDMRIMYRCMRKKNRKVREAYKNYQRLSAAYEPR